ncbi:Rpn family recombination-promoting nuclease/putative transposase [Paenibacillus cymbidii]|uniref:Rpn family recombination-promoting nuclease/putative transposase n=1 Tax=Paenibacillus cymbidii TaxID=1639034 RepID=UPI001081673A|nr:Rpn family recombination-promoting nuclease/putative transposase [Paenibacillus cymbidii]
MESMVEFDIIFYLLMEFQSTVDMEMPYRLLLYQVEIWRYYLRNREEKGPGHSFALPAIVPIVLYNGERPWTAKRQYDRRRISAGSIGRSAVIAGAVAQIDGIDSAHAGRFARAISELAGSSD